MELQGLIFDCDGTLADTDDVHVATWAERASRVYEQPERAQGAARSVVRWLATPANAFFALLDVVGLDTVVMRLMIRTHGSGDPGRLPVIAGAADAVKALQGRYTLGVVTTRGPVTWFYKLSGPVALTASQRDAFDRFLATVRHEG